MCGPFDDHAHARRDGPTNHTCFACVDLVTMFGEKSTYLLHGHGSWLLQISRFDPQSVTLLFNLADSGQHCFVLAMRLDIKEHDPLPSN